MWPVWLRTSTILKFYHYLALYWKQRRQRDAVFNYLEVSNRLFLRYSVTVSHMGLECGSNNNISLLFYKLSFIVERATECIFHIHRLTRSPWVTCNLINTNNYGDILNYCCRPQSYVCSSSFIYNVFNNEIFILYVFFSSNQNLTSSTSWLKRRDFFLSDNPYGCTIISTIISYICYYDFCSTSFLFFCFIYHSDLYNKYIQQL